MKLIQLSLPLLIATLQGHHVSSNIHNSCQKNLVPGIQRMSRGIDITTLDLFPSDLLTPNGFKNGLFNFSCNLNLTWKHPTIPNYYYALPDQIAVINTVPGGALKIKTHFYETMDEYKESLSVQIGVSVNYGLGSFSASSSYKEAQEQLLKTNKSVAETSAYISAVEIDFKSSAEMQTNQKFVNHITQLEQYEYENAIELYDGFVDTFGTHYFESGLFGGYLYHKTIIDNEYMRTASKEELSVNIKASFFGITAQGGMESSDSKVSEKFSSNTETSFYYYGGITDLTNHDDRDNYLSGWWNTVPRDPWLFSGQLRPIELLIANENVRSQVKKAILFKRTKAYLSELKNALFLSQIKLSNEETSDIDEFEQFLNNPLSSAFDIEKMGGDIGKIFDRVEEIRDRALLAELQQKLWDTYQTIMTCKEELVDGCNTKLKNNVKQQIEMRKIVCTKIYEILTDNGKPNHKDAQKVIQEASQLIQYQQTEVVDFCGADSSCQQCMKNMIDYWNGFSSCSNHLVWKIFQCSPYEC